ncbi:MAG: ABC-F family ATP-binding cassette domain-containing protein [Bacteroidaceae bacterium]|nr:ABC-F family ATP-binding cassette domain-containing protein [Bacteroidaceae bacterium]
MAATILDVQGLTKAIGDLVLFSDVSFSMSERQRTGLIAKNGAGKTTLLNIICGDEDYNDGQIVFRRDLRVGYLPQHPAFPPELTVMEACFEHANATTELIKAYEHCLATPGNPGLEQLVERMDQAQAWDYEARVKQILSKLKIDDFDARVATLSGGQVKRIALAGVLMMEPDLLVLDEPTNHLDLDMIEWLEQFLQTSSFALLMVTHDRYFLDRVCNQIMELDARQLYVYNGNYSYYLEKRQQRIDARNSEIERANNLYRRELEWMRRTPSARGHKARYREEAFYELEQRAHQRIEEKRTRLELKSAYIGNKIFEADYISKAFGPDKIILKDFFYTFSRYEKMGIVGNNGTGKTTFIKLLLGLEKPDSGRFTVGETVRFGYYSQEGLQFREDAKVIDIVRDIAEYVDLGGGRHLSASQFLQHFLFAPDRQYTYVRKLSGGERRRLYLCTVLMRNPNFLVLDEPTNDLDIITLQVLEEYLQAFHGCVIIVSHDRYFMDKVVDHLLVFQGQGVVKDFPGNYTQFREEMLKRGAVAAKDEPQEGAKPKANVKIKSPQARKLSYKEQRELQQLGDDIDRLEQEKRELEAALCSGTLSVDDITAKSRRLPQLEAELDEKSMRWLELSEIAEGG